MADPLNWDEFRIVKAIAETHSLGGAAERLGLNHSTMFRRLTALETRLGVRLFERERSGYRPTAAGEDMASLAVIMGRTIEEFERRVVGNDLQLSGTLRLTTLVSLGCMVLPRIVAGLLARHPSLHVEFVLTDANLDLLRGDADIALRTLKGPPSEGLTGRRVARLRWGAYAAHSLVDRYGDSTLSAAPWIMPTEAFGPRQAQYWLDSRVEPWRRVATAGSEIAIAELAAHGVGVALLPCYIGCVNPELRRIEIDDGPDLDRDLWLLTQPQALRSQRVRTVLDYLGDEIESRRAWFEGEPSSNGQAGEPTSNRQAGEEASPLAPENLQA